MGITIWGELWDGVVGELWSTVVVCGEDSNLAWVNHKGDSVFMGGMGGTGGSVVS